MEKISYAKTVYGQKEIDAVVNCLKSSTQMGLNAGNLKKKLPRFLKGRLPFVNSGSSALYLGIEAYEFPPRSEVITPVLTFSTTVGCLVKNNLIPVFADVLNTYCIDENQIESLITDKTVAILVPNLLGNLPNWIKIREIANKYNLIVIEDSADTLGAKINGNVSGSYSDMSILAFMVHILLTALVMEGLFV